MSAVVPRARRRTPAGLAASALAWAVIAAGSPGTAGAAEVAAAATGSAAAAPATPAAPTAITRVTYLSGPTVYVEAGRDDGVQVGDLLDVLHDGAVVATLSVTFVSAHRAACSLVEPAAPIGLAVGDVVRYTPRRAAPRPGDAAGGAATAGPSTAAPGGAAPAMAADRVRRGTGLRGRVGLRYLVVRDHSLSDAGFSQRGVDLWLMDQGLGPFDLHADIRARRSYRADGGADRDDSLTNVYRLAVAWHPGDRRQTVTFGRQFSPALSMMSLFDGVLWEFNGGAWSAGGFAGAEPEPVDLKVSSDVRDYGGYWQYRGGSGEARRWEITTGLVGSYQDGDPNREFLYLQGRYHGRRLTAFLVEEIDYYRGWKTDDAGESAVSLTSTYASLNYRAGDRVTLHGGFDNRRNVRLYRDRVTPATDFDDAHRQGGWGGATFRLGRHLDLGADLRRSTGGPSGTADGYSFNMAVVRLTRANLEFRGRATRYANAENTGSLYAIGAGIDAGSRVRLEAGVGRLDEASEREAALDRGADWIDLDVSVLLGRRWFLMLSGEQYRGDDDEDNDQFYGALSFRF